MQGTIWQALESIGDRRTEKGRRYRLASLHAIAIAGFADGCVDLKSVSTWARDLPVTVMADIGITRARAPCHATFHYVMRSTDVAELAAAFVRLLGAPLVPRPSRSPYRRRQDELSPAVALLRAAGAVLADLADAMEPAPGETRPVHLLRALREASVPSREAASTGPDGADAASGRTHARAFG